jgi:hypothetical protein
MTIDLPQVVDLLAIALNNPLSGDPARSRIASRRAKIAVIVRRTTHTLRLTGGNRHGEIGRRLSIAGSA